MRAAAARRASRCGRTTAGRCRRKSGREAQARPVCDMTAREVHCGFIIGARRTAHGARRTAHDTTHGTRHTAHVRVMTRHPFRRVCRFAWARPTLSKPFTAHRARAAWRPFRVTRQPHPRDERVVIRRMPRTCAAVHDHVDQPFARMNPDPVQREHRVDGRERARRRRAPEPRDERLQRPAAREPFVDVAEQDHRHRPVSKAASSRCTCAPRSLADSRGGRDHAQRERAAIDVGVERAAQFARGKRQVERACRADRAARQHRCRSGAPACRSSGRPPHACRSRRAGARARRARACRRAGLPCSAITSASSSSITAAIRSAARAGHAP